MRVTILDCYTDEASGLGVPPYLGTYPRYLFGKYTLEGHEVTYLTIDDLRLWRKYGGVKKVPKVSEKTDIYTYNTTIHDAAVVLGEREGADGLCGTDFLVVVLGVHVPGKYLSAMPGTLHEIVPMISDLPMRKILTGPAVFGTQLQGGKKSEIWGYEIFDSVLNSDVSFDELEKFCLLGCDIIKQIPDKRVIEIETGRGCNVGKCSFCTEPLKNKFVNRSKKYVVSEVVEYYKRGARFFRLGKQADFYASDDPIGMLREIRLACPDLEMLHIDNVNPNSVVKTGGEEITRAIVEYCTPGNIAAFGVESFDFEVVKANLLNTMPAMAFRAIEIINKYGAERGSNGMPKFLPGINIIFGLLGESKKTHKANMDAFRLILDKGWMLRRINVRQVAVLPGTYLELHGGQKFWFKNKGLYWKWRNDIRQKVDNPMLTRILPMGTVIHDVYAEIYDGKTTFCRQMGTYPLAIGVAGRLVIGQKYSISVTGYMLRSITGKVV